MESSDKLILPRIKQLGKEYKINSNSISYWNSLIDNPDALLKRIGKDIQVYDDMLNDSHLYAVIQSRKSGTLSKEWELDQYDSEQSIYDFVEVVLNNLDIHDCIRSILDAPLFGFQPIEIIWEVIDGKLIPVKLNKRPRQYFKFDVDNNLVFIDDNGSTEITPNDKFLIPRYEASRDNPYGTPLLSKCYWSIVLKNDARKSWSVFIEKFGMPWVKTLYKSQRYQSQEDVDALLDRIYSYSADSMFALPDDVELDLINGTQTSSSEIYNAFINKCMEDVSEVILGHTSATTSTPGKLGNENMAQSVVDRIIESDMILVESTFNTLIKKIVDLNFNTNQYPYFRLVEEQDINKDRAERDNILFGLGLRFTEDYYIREYNLYKDDFTLNNSNVSGDLSPKKLMNPSNFINILNSDDKDKNGEKEQEITDKFIEHLLDPDKNETLFTDLIKPIIDYAGKNKLDDLKKNYYKAYSKIDASDFIEIIERAILIIQIYGLNSVDEEEEEQKDRFNYFNRDDISLQDLIFALDKEPEEIVAYFRSKGVKISDDWQDTFKIIKQHAFTVAGVVKMDLLVDFKEMIEKAIKEGLSQEEFKKQLKERFKEKGWLKDKDNNKLIEPWRLDTIYRTNLQDAFMQGRWNGHTLNIKNAPYVMCSSVMDNSTTSDCRALDGQVFRIDDDYFAKNLRPPGHYNCRRITISLSENLVKKRGYKVNKGIDFKNHRNQKGFDNKGNPWLPNKSDYPSELWKEFEKDK